MQLLFLVCERLLTKSRAYCLDTTCVDRPAEQFDVGNSKRAVVTITLLILKTMITLHGLQVLINKVRKAC